MVVSTELEQQLLRNVLADVLAHHEARAADPAHPSRSLVLTHELGPCLDWQRAGAIAASIFESAGTDIAGRPLFTLPARLLPPPAARAGGPGEGEWPAPGPTNDPIENLAGKVIGAAREVFPVDAVRVHWLLKEIRRYRPGCAALTGLQQLTDAQLRQILERIDGHRVVKNLADLAPGVHRKPAS